MPERRAPSRTRLPVRAIARTPGLAFGFALGLALAAAGASAGTAASAAGPARPADDAPYRARDFDRVEKIDVHVHLNGPVPRFLARARRDRMKLLAINVDYPDFPPLATQRAIALALAQAHPREVAWATSFPLRDGDVDDPAWAARTIADVDRDLALGAVAVKVWKNLGLVAKDRAGRLPLIDDPRLDPLFTHWAGRGTVVLGHQGEPFNAWRPLEAMTIAGDRSYFAGHPQYHLLRHPELPGRDAQLAARDARLRRTPGLRYVGLHLASLEDDVDALAAFLDRFPDATVDLAARLVHLQRQAARDRGKVRAFVLRHADRLLYGTDLTREAGGGDGADADFAREADATWRADWRFLATADAMRSPEFPGAFRGLALPRGVIDQIYRTNAQRVFGAAAWTAAPAARVTIPADLRP